MSSQKHEYFVSGEITSETVLRKAVDKEKNVRRRDVQYRPARKGDQLGWLVESTLRIVTEDWLEQLRKATLIEQRLQEKNTQQNYQTNILSRSVPQSQPRHLPVRSDSHNARNDMQRRDRKYYRHAADPNGVSVTVTSGRGVPLPTTPWENHRRDSVITQGHDEDPRIPRTMSLPQQDLPPRSSSLKLHTDRESDASQRKQEQALRTTLSNCALLFAGIEVADFLNCWNYIKLKPEVLEEDSAGFLKEAIYALGIGNGKHAMQCISRAIVLNKCQDMPKKEIASYFSELCNREGRAFREFQSEFQKVWDHIKEKVGPVAGPKPVQEASPPLSSMQRLSIYQPPTSQRTQPGTGPKSDRHGHSLPLNQPARPKPPNPDDDDDDDDTTIGHQRHTRHATRGPTGDEGTIGPQRHARHATRGPDGDDDDDDDDGTLGHKMKIRSRMARHEDNEASYSDEPDFDPYGPQVDRSRPPNMEAIAKDSRKRSDPGGRERAPPGAARPPKGDDDEDDDDEDETFGHREIPRPRTHRDERKRIDREITRDVRPIVMVMASGPERGPRPTGSITTTRSKQIKYPSSYADVRQQSYSGS